MYRNFQGKKYDANLTAKDIAKEIRRFCKKFDGCKFSITSNSDAVWIELHQVGKSYTAAEVLAQVKKELHSYEKDNSDVETDYFDCNYYFFVSDKSEAA